MKWAAPSNSGWFGKHFSVTLWSLWGSQEWSRPALGKLPVSPIVEHKASRKQARMGRGWGKFHWWGKCHRAGLWESGYCKEQR